MSELRKRSSLSSLDFSAARLRREERRRQQEAEREQERFRRKVEAFIPRQGTEEAWECPDCGNLVGDREKHLRTFHSQRVSRSSSTDFRWP